MYSLGETGYGKGKRTWGRAMAEANQGITRRHALKRGLVIGTGVLWATPVIQGIRMSEAYAQVTSTGPGGSQPAPPEVGGGDISGPSGPGPSGPPGPVGGGGVTGPSTPEVGGKVVVAAPQGPSAGVVGPTDLVTDVTAETLPLTGIEVLPLAALGSGLMAAGAATLKIAKQTAESDAPSGDSPSVERD